ncbi:MAG: CinA family nicotinamide mononucleotide deamidase-related protein [Anaerolineae bacterium]|jgi:nicotinamide-nucleotide amidase
MQAEIVTIGTELLLGEIVDTNSAWIAQQLTGIGLDLLYTTTVGDNLGRITKVLAQSLERSDVVITTGGLGPTVDDMTRQGVAAATGCALVLDDGLVEEIATYFGRRGFQMTDNNRRQAYIPSGARIIHNPVGTAPCFAVEHDAHLIICLPGVPHEMRHLMETEVIPLLRERFGLLGVIQSRVLRTCNIGESAVDAQIDDLMTGANPTVGTRAHPGQTDVVVTAKALSREAALEMIAPVEAEIRRRIGDYVFGTDDETMGQVVLRELAARGLRLAVAETYTRGEVAQQLANQGQSAAFAGSVLLSDVSSLLAMAVGVADASLPFPSQQAADLAAREVARVYDAQLGLAIIASDDAAPADGSPAYLTLYAGGEQVTVSPRRVRSGAVGRSALMFQGLDLARRHLLGLPQLG